MYPTPPKSTPMATTTPAAIEGSTPGSGESAEPSAGAAPESALDEILQRLNWGNIAFNTPPTMGYGETRTIHLIVDPSRSIPELEESIAEAGPKEGARVQIAPRMQAQLTGDGFSITPITPDSQPVSNKGPTEWKWDIRPKGFGSQSLHLSLNALLKVEGESLPRSIKTFDKNIVVQVVWPATVIAYPQDHWQIFAGSVAALLAILRFGFGIGKRAD